MAKTGTMPSKQNRPGGRAIACGIAALVAGLVVTATMADAQNIRRVDGRRLSCASVQDIIAREGAVILRTTSPYSGRLLWERYVHHRGFCFSNEITEFRFVTTADTDRCYVKRCRERRRRRWFLYD